MAMMDRRKLFGWLAATPLFAGLVTRDPADAKPIKSEFPFIPLGFIKDETFVVPSSGKIWLDERGRTTTYPYLHYGKECGYVKRRRMIWNGSKFVELDSQDGAVVLNRVIQGYRSAA